MALQRKPKYVEDESKIVQSHLRKTLTIPKLEYLIFLLPQSSIECWMFALVYFISVLSFFLSRTLSTFSYYFLVFESVCSAFFLAFIPFFVSVFRVELVFMFCELYLSLCAQFCSYQQYQYIGSFKNFPFLSSLGALCVACYI